MAYICPCVCVCAHTHTIGWCLHVYTHAMATDLDRQTAMNRSGQVCASLFVLELYGVVPLYIVTHTHIKQSIRHINTERRPNHSRSNSLAFKLSTTMTLKTESRLVDDHERA